MVKFIDLFAGIGGFRYGIERAYDDQLATGIQQGIDQQIGDDAWDALLGAKPLCIYSNEWDKYASSVYRRHYGQCDTRDIRTVNASEIPDFDLLCGGFPCQAFSVAGKRQGWNDTRGTLFFEIARIVKEKRPSYLLLENVKGLLNHEQGRTFAVILATLDELGYDLQWQLCNSKDFGVPQSRERVYIVGNLRGKPRPQVFPFGDVYQVPSGSGKSGQGRAQAQYSTTVRTKTMRADDTFIKETQKLSDAMRVRGVDGPSVTLKSLGGGLGAKTGLYAIPVLTPDRREKSQNGRRFKEDGDPSFTLTAQDKHGVYDGFSIRRLTPVECERLQGFPDNWTLYGDVEKTVSVYGASVDTHTVMSDTQRYKMCGNAVTTNVISAIFDRMFPLDTAT